MKVGILGGGQLAQMLTVAALPLGISTLCLDPLPEVCANRVTQVMCAELNDVTALQQFAEQVDVITLETENIPLLTMNVLKQIRPTYPNVDALQITQDRLLEKQCCHALTIPTTEFLAVNSRNDIETAATKFGFPFLIKTRRMGYDGKGQVMIHSIADCQTAWNTVKQQACIAEAIVKFDRELSLIAVQNANGDTRFYPLCANEHYQGILRLTRVTDTQVELQQQAETIAHKLLKHFNYVGVLTLEFFQIGQNLLVNEIAPRVHNSGHWTIEGADCSQFENHIRAITNLPLGSTQTRGFNAMVNIIGALPTTETVLTYPQAHFHLYGKTPRPQRKLGHVTLSCDTLSSLESQLQSLQRLTGIHYG